MKKILLIMLVLLVVPFVSAETIVIEDDFNRPNSASLGTATNGNVWQGTGGITSNQAIFVTGDNANLNLTKSYNNTRTNFCMDIVVNTQSIIGSFFIYYGNITTKNLIIHFDFNNDIEIEANDGGFIDTGVDWSLGIEKELCVYRTDTDKVQVFYDNTLLGTYIVNLTSLNNIQIRSFNNAAINFGVDNILTIENKNQIFLTIRNENNNTIITDQVNLTVTSDDYYQTYSTSTGTVLLENLTDQESYEIQVRTSDYNNFTAYVQMNEQTAQGYNIYLNQDGVAKTFTVRSTDTQILADAQLKVDKFINGTWTQLYTVATDVTGQAILYLIEGDVYRITASKVGYDPLTIVQEFPEDVYPITLDFARDLDFNGFTAGVSWAYQPVENYLNPSDNQTFNFTVSAQGNDLASFAILAYNGSTFINSVSGSNPTGGTLSLEINTTSYLNENINIRYRFTKENFTSYTIPVPYYIQDVNITGTFVEMRNFIVDNISIRDRIIIYTIIMFVFILCLALLGNMYMVAFVASALSPFVGYLTGINVIFLTLLSLVIMLSLFINPRGGGL